MLRIEKKKKYPLVIVTVVALVAIMVIGGLIIKHLNNDSDPDFVIVKVEPETNEAKGGADVSLRYAGYVTLLHDEEKIVLNFTNPSTSRKSLALELVANIDGEEVIIGRSGIVHPGYKIQELRYSLGRKIPYGKYKGKYVVYFYNEQGKEEIIGSEIAMSVLVK